MYYVYIVECKDGSFYTGTAADLTARLAKHNTGKGAKYTRSRSPVELKYYEQLESRSEALRREYALRKLTREEKIRLISEQPDSTVNKDLH